jgi:hypothetical protein
MMAVEEVVLGMIGEEERNEKEENEGCVRGPR